MKKLLFLIVVVPILSLGDGVKELREKYRSTVVDHTPDPEYRKRVKAHRKLTVKDLDRIKKEVIKLKEEKLKKDPSRGALKRWKKHDKDNVINKSTPPY